MKSQKCRAYISITLGISVIAALLGMVTPGTLAAWSTETNLTANEAWDRCPSVMQTRNGTMWVAWASDRDPIYMQLDIYYATSSDYGSSWSDPFRLTRHLATDDSPSLMQTQNGTIWIVWASNRTSNLELIYRTSPDHGATWSPITQLTTNASNDASPEIVQNIDGTIWIVWHREVEKGNFDIFCKNSSDNGLTWSDEISLTTDSSWDLGPSITHTDNGTIWVTWSSARTSDYEIYYKTATNNGTNWQGIKRLTTNSAWETTPAVLQAVDGTIWIFFSSNRDADKNDLFYTTSSDYGTNWSEETELDGMSNYDDEDAAVTNTNERRIWVFWHSLRTLDYEVFYTISDEITSVHDLAVTKITAWMPPGRLVYSAPRGIPFYVNVTVENQGNYAETFSLTTYADRITNDVRVVVGTQSVSLSSGDNTTVTFTWDTANATETPSGSYFLSAEATPVPGEYDTADNMLYRGAYVGGIFDAWKQPHVNLFAKFSPLALTILTIAALGIAAISIFKLVMSMKPLRPRRLINRRYTQNMKRPCDKVSKRVGLQKYVET